MKTILITGANSGIGEALALEYAKNKNNLLLIARNEEKLKIIADKCKEYGSVVEYKSIDVTSREELSEWIKKIDKKYPIDIVYANAGVSETIVNNSKKKNNKNIYEIFDINIYGVLNTILPSIELMKKRNKGQIAVMSSMAGFRGMASAPYYSSTKNCIKALGEALRGDLYKYNIGVSIICPGFIKTPLTDLNKFPMPFLMSAEKASEIIIKKVDKNKGLIAFPLTVYFSIKLMNCLPFFISDFIFKKLPKK